MDREQAFRNASYRLKEYREHLVKPKKHWPGDVFRALNCWNCKLFDPSYTVWEFKNENKTPGNNFSSRFKHYVKMTLRDYRAYHRINAAMMLLADKALEDLEIGEIGWLVGYEKVQSFSTAFKRKTGISPGKWREQQLSNEKNEE